MLPLLLSHSCLVTCLGVGAADHLAALQGGSGGLRPCRFETVEIPTYVGEIAGVDTVILPDPLFGFDCRNHRIAELALRQDGFEAAVMAARDRHGPSRIGLFLGTSTSGILQSELAYRRRAPETGALPADLDYERTHNTFALAAYLQRRLGLGGQSAVISAACASTAKAFGNAARNIAAGFCDAAIVGGADSLCLTTLYGFRSLFLTSPEPCRPFDAERDGISIGEAAGFVLLEKADSRQESAADGVFLLGVGESSDAYHMSAPHPEGIGAQLAMRRALDDAGLTPSAIDYVNLHGTATQVGDAAEDQAICAVFGTATPCSSTKGFTGHTLGAAGIVEAVLSSLAIRQAFMPGSPTTRHPDPAFRSRYLLSAQSGRVDRVVSNSFGFGGSNCSLVLGRA